MNLVLVGKKKIQFEKNRNTNDLTVMFVPDEDAIQVFHDLQGNKTDYEVATRAGSPDKKPAWRDIGGKIALYGWIPDELKNRTSSIRVWLPQDFLPEGITIFYFAVSPNHLVHGRKEVDDEQKTSWRVTTIPAATEEELISLIKSSLVDQMMTGDSQVPSVAVYQNAPLQAKIDEALKYLNVTSQPLEKMSPAFRQVPPLYKQRNNTLVLLVLMLFFFLILMASTVYWILGIMESRKMEQQIEEVRYAIQNIQINERIGHIKAPEGIQDRIKSPFKQLPSSFTDAALRIGVQFGELDKMKFEIPLTAGESTFTAGPGLEPGVYRFSISTATAVQGMLVDQESMAREIVAVTPWLREISNISAPNPNSDGLNLILKLQVEETPEMEALRQAEGTPAPMPVAVTQPGVPLVNPDPVVTPTDAVAVPEDVSAILPENPVTDPAPGEAALADASATLALPRAPSETVPAALTPEVSPTAAAGGNQ